MLLLLLLKLSLLLLLLLKLSLLLLLLLLKMLWMLNVLSWEIGRGSWKGRTRLKLRIGRVVCVLSKRRGRERKVGKSNKLVGRNGIDFVKPLPLGRMEASGDVNGLAGLGSRCGSGTNGKLGDEVGEIKIFVSDTDEATIPFLKHPLLFSADEFIEFV